VGQRSERATLQVTPAVRIPFEEIAVRFDTSGGPGGQHANRSQTRVELTFDAAASTSLSETQRERIVHQLGSIVTSGAGDTRSQTRNRELAFERLATKLADALHEDPTRRSTRPTRSSKVKRLDAKRRTGQRKALRRPPSVND
jgi:ribosome-associated protein